MISIELTSFRKKSNTELESTNKPKPKHSTLEQKKKHRRNSWPIQPQVSRKENGCPMCRLDTEIGKVKMKIMVKKKVLQNKVYPITRWFPLVLAISTLVLTPSDMYTDGASTHRICTAQCNCEYVAGDCGIPTPIYVCESAFINGIPVKFYCQEAGTNETECRNKDIWPVPKTCRCFWDEYSHGSKCNSPQHQCGWVYIDGLPGSEYCSQYGKASENDCTKLPEWEQADNLRAIPSWSIRHWDWCKRSIIFLVGPSILNNLLILYNLIKNKKYKTYFIASGLNFVAEFHLIIICLVLISMALFQILPFLCLILKIVIVARQIMGYKVSLEDLEEFNAFTMKMMLFFTFTEDLPQLYFQYVFFVRSVYGLHDGIEGGLSWMAVAGLVTSCLSLSFNYTKYTTNLLKYPTSPLILFITAALASCRRTLTACFTPEFAIMESNYTNQTLLPGASVITIQFVLVLFRFTFRIFRKILLNNSYTLRHNVSSPKQTKFQRVLNAACNFVMLAKTITCSILINVKRNMVTVHRTILFREAIDGCSIAGLWSSACFASWAIWNKLSATYLKGQYPTDSVNMVEVTTTALTLTMLSYSINIIMVLQNDQDKVEGLLVSLLFIIFPIRLFWVYPDINGATHAILIPIVTVAGLAILAMLLALVLGRKKTEKIYRDNIDNDIDILIWILIFTLIYVSWKLARIFRLAFS